MPRPYFVADQATVTVLKPVASSAFGSYKLSVPEDVDINDVHEFAAPGNELGYVASLAPKGVRVGGFARRFVRADVNVTAADTTDPDWVPSSDVDKVLTEAAARVEGDFFLESDITKAGLGPWIPFTHFEQGDLATVEIWGRRVPLPVTRIEPKVTDHDENDWAVHVGGQVLTDDEARLAENETLRQAAVQSRREVAGLESQTAKAVSTADSANAKSDQALKAATDADGTIQSKLDEQRQLSSEFSAEVSKAESAAASASDAFRQVDILVNSPDGVFRRGVSDALAAQDDVNQAQEEINATQSNINRQQGEINTALSNATKAASNAATDAKTAADAATQTAADAVSTANLVKEQQAAYEALSEERNALQDSNIQMLADLQKEQLRAQGNIFIIGGDTTVSRATVSNSHFSKSEWGVYLTALGSWTGRIIFTSHGQTSADGPRETWIYEVPVPLPDGSRQINLFDYTPGYSLTDTDWMQVQYWSYPAVQYRSKETGGSFTATQNAWTTIGTHTISRSNQQEYFAGSWRVFWGAANRGSTYGIRIVTSSGTVLKENITTELGPLSILGNGRWSMYTQVSGVDIPAGQDVYFQVYCSHSGTSQRGIYKSESAASWLEEK